MDPLTAVGLTTLMERTSGSADVTIGLVDGPVAFEHPDFAGAHLRQLAGHDDGSCRRADSLACVHGTFVAGILCAKRGSNAPAICPGCSLLVRPVFLEPATESAHMPSATPESLATAIVECVSAGARVINLSLGLARPSATGHHALERALHHAASRGVVVVAAAGNQGTLGSSAITRHPWVISVAACDGRGVPIDASNLGGSIGRYGLSSPGDHITSLGPEGPSQTFGGTSVAAPFVTGAIALLLSHFPSATAAQIKLAIVHAHPRRSSVVPPLLDAARAFHILEMQHERERSH